MLKNLKYPLGIAGASIGMGLVGNALGSTDLEEAGATGAKFTGVATNLVGAGMVTGMLGDIIKLKQGGKKNGKTSTSNRIF